MSRNKRAFGLYAVRFANGVIKVGKSTDLKNRVKEHIDAGRGFGIAVKEVVLNPCPAISEDDLIAYCKSLDGINHYGEWFREIPFSCVRAYVLTGVATYPQHRPRSPTQPARQASLLNPDFFKGSAIKKQRC